MAHAPIDLTNDTFDEAIKSDTPTLVDFWAEWCGPCRQLGPVLDKLAEETAGRMVVAKVDVDTARALAERYGIQAIPHLVLFRRGEIVTRLLGGRPLESLREVLFPLLPPSPEPEG